MPGFMHMNATKQYIRSVIEDRGAEFVFGDEWKGRDDDALTALDNDPREVIPIGDCDNQDERGYCRGHQWEPNE